MLTKNRDKNTHMYRATVKKYKSKKIRTIHNKMYVKRGVIT